MNENLVTMSAEQDHHREVKGSILMIEVDESIEPASFKPSRSELRITAISKLQLCNQ